MASADTTHRLAPAHHMRTDSSMLDDDGDLDEELSPELREVLEGRSTIARITEAMDQPPVTSEYAMANLIQRGSSHSIPRRLPLDIKPFLPKDFLKKSDSKSPKDKKNEVRNSGGEVRNSGVGGNSSGTTTPTRPSSPPQSLGAEDPRVNIVLEVVSSEESYVSGLQILLNQFHMRLEALNKLPDQKPILTDAEIDSIFINAKDIYDLNSKFLDELQELLEAGEAALLKGIGPLFVYYAKFFKIYSLYCNAYHAANRALQRLTSRKPEFQLFLAVSEYCAGKTLSSFLISPVQRIPRYVLLLENLTKASNGLKPIPQLSEANDLLQEVADQINESLREADARQRVVEIQQKVFRNRVKLVEPSRLCLMCGELTKLHQNPLFRLSKSKKVLCILFNDLFIYATLPTTSNVAEVRFKTSLALLEYEDLPDKDGLNNGFRVGTKEKGYAVYADNPQKKKEWLTAFAEAKEKIGQGPSILKTSSVSVRDNSVASVRDNSMASVRDSSAESRDRSLGLEIKAAIAANHNKKAAWGHSAGSSQDSVDEKEDSVMDSVIDQIDREVVRNSVWASKQMSSGLYSSIGRQAATTTGITFVSSGSDKSLNG